MPKLECLIYLTGGSNNRGLESGRNWDCPGRMGIGKSELEMRFGIGLEWMRIGKSESEMSKEEEDQNWIRMEGLERRNRMNVLPG